mgnify:CR=1 FL=1
MRINQMTNNQILIELKSVYGETKAYPLCEKAKEFAAMLGTKTLTPHALKSIKKLGFEYYCIGLKN